ncbi:hypothetical protein ACGFIG_30485 [Micromonospora sp. NPDC049048]|uniref:hypothetical protein n=1 Tax=Micromonospora sp. NPDC049048 TaxID=3364263 RepID=UPI00371AFEDA
MARKSPGALRAQSRLAGRSGGKTSPIDGLSSRANAAIVRLQLRHPKIGSVATALTSYRRAIWRSGRWLELLGDCPCPSCDPVGQRDILEGAMRRLPPAARRELRRVVDALDEEFLRKTLPDPRAAELNAWDAQAWWRHRLRGR